MKTAAVRLPSLSGRAQESDISLDRGVRRSVLAFARANAAVHNATEGANVMLGLHNLIAILLVGLIAGWLASKLVQGTGLGIIGDIIIGILGAFVGRWLFDHFHIRIGVNIWVDAILTAAAGAIVLLVVLRLVRR